MNLKLKGKVVVITGGTSGIGKAAAFAFVKEGCKVVVSGRNLDKINAVTQEAKQTLGEEILAVQADASVGEDMKMLADKAVEKYGGIDIWVNNAGHMPMTYVIDMEEEEFDKVFTSNVKSVYLGAKMAAEKMKGKGGVILNASSCAAFIPSVKAGAYGASKAAIINLTRTLAAELAPMGIRVNAYAPGVTVTELTREYIETKGDAGITEQISLRKIAEPEDIGDVVVMMASDVTRYVTGTFLEISGGKLCVQNPQAVW